MATLEKDLVFLILQYLDEEKHKETFHRLESESGCYFNMRYFKELVTNGEWDETEKYLLGFTKIDSNEQSMKIFFEIRKHKYLEALDKRDDAKAVNTLRKDLRMFAPFSEDLFKEMTLLLSLDDFRENPKLSTHGDTTSARGALFRDLKKLIKVNPLFRDKLDFPTIKTSRLRTLINQSLNWQHQLCKNPKPNPGFKTLFVDHICKQPSAVSAASPAINQPDIAAEVLPPHGPAPGAIIPAAPVAPVKRRRSASSGAGCLLILNPLRAYEISFPLIQVFFHIFVMGFFQVGNTLPVPYSGQPHGHNTLSPDDLPKVVATTLSQGSRVTSMDFHPVQQILLLVGTVGGAVFLWDVGARKKISKKGFDVWKLEACSKELQASLYADETASANHVAWSPDGTLFGVAYSKNIVHIYSFDGGNDIPNHLEIEAHTGSVNHLAFSYPNEQLFVVTCGDDRLVKVWDVATGAIRFTFEGHEAPVFSICPHQKENIQFVFSAATDGKIKTWLYDELGERGTYDAPGNSLTRMAYSSDGTRLFSCGTNEGESFLVEWDETEGSIKRTYQGLGLRAVGIVQFDTTKNRFLATGDESTIKIWDMDNTNPLTTIHADGGLPASPCVRFNKEGTLLAVSTSEHGVRILATNEGFRLLRTAENRWLARKVPGGVGFGSSSANAGITMADQSNSFAAMKKNEVRSLADGKPRTSKVSGEGSTSWKVTEITEPSQCYSLRLSDNVTDTKVSRLIYTNSGSGVLALASNAEHKLWKWQNSDPNLDGKATANAHPVLWKPKSGIMMMMNETSDKNPEEAIPCLALSKNDCYLVSASGGEISVFNMLTFKCMATCVPPPPASTFLAFHPSENNIIGIGFEDSSIKIYNLRNDEVRAILKGHKNRITGLAFSRALDVLVSSSADSQLCVWGMFRWKKRCSKYLQVPQGRSTPAVSNTQVQFHQNGIHLLVVNETHIAIYDAQKLDLLNNWFRLEAITPITSGTYSGDSQSIFVSFEDGTVDVLTASNLRLRCRINPTAYLPSNPRSYPLVIAAHPSESNQFAVGLSNGHVYVVEPSETEGRWGTSPPGST
ncbi:hypothetical protein Bca52824_005583 [Brassica carinata]|uniref:CTLH domain-containing protein n=1 Tax=Brassica carinata TaxID=52824 RepID=A0A8X8BH34_BRACI|nr:hypothetical protein Bca52824_005583 [Brassica carinata]